MVFAMTPIKDYESIIYWRVIVLIALYDLWCIVHGVMLSSTSSASMVGTTSPMHFDIIMLPNLLVIVPFELTLN